MVSGAVVQAMGHHTPPSRQIRVAYVVQNLNFGGMERVLHDLASRLPPQGFEVHVVVLEYLGRFAEGLPSAVVLHQAPGMSPLSLLYPKKLAKLLRAISPDVIHSHGGVWLKSSGAARLAHVPVAVHTDHGRPDPVGLIDRIIDNWASRPTRAVVAVSEPLAELLRRQVVRDPSKVSVIPNGVDVEEIRPAVDRAALRQELGIPTDALVIGSVGRLEPVKNYQLALHALRELSVSPPSEGAPYLVLVGDGSERQMLETLARRLGLLAQVKFLGWRRDAEHVYGAFDLFTLTSLSEGTSISLLEAMSSAVCPVVTDVGGNRAVLGDAMTSLLVPSGSVGELAGAWGHLLRQAPRRAEMGQRARDRVVATFSIEAMVERHAALYRALLAEATGRPARPSQPTGRPRP